ncbi:TolC family outer membrane protein [Acetobacteraceae bacterium B3987]|nr:TolC family outer membrane protein [Acetobacteraceae bacterium B3987]
MYLFFCLSEKRHAALLITFISLLLPHPTLAATDPDPTPAPVTHLSLPEAMAIAYRSNPQILREQAILRQTDESMPEALSGWRPTVTGSATANYNESNYVTFPYGGSFRYNQKFRAPGYAAGVTVSEPIFRGGKTWASMRKARSSILGERAHLVEIEQQLFINVVSAYVAVTQARALLALTLENEHTLKGQVELTTRQLALNQATRTDALQAESQYEAAQASTRQAEGQVRVAEATFQRVIGIVAPEKLSPAERLPSPFVSEAQINQLAINDLPQVMQAQYQLESAKHDVKLAIAELLPEVSAQASYQRQVNQGNGKFSENATAVMLQASLPLYQGGSEYAHIRAAKQAVNAALHNLAEQRREARENALSAWQKLAADSDQLARNQKAVATGVEALHAIQQQELLGVRTTFEVLQQQELLFDQQKTLVQNTANLIQDSYQLAAATGHLTAKELKLHVTLYDPHTHYHQVKWKLIGME